jgi:DNA-binding NtrC family response regulator
MKPRNVPVQRKPAAGKAGPRSAGRLQRALDAAATREIRAALNETKGNMAEAARRLGVSYKGLWKRLRSLAIDPDRFRK